MTFEFKKGFAPAVHIYGAPFKIISTLHSVSIIVALEKVLPISIFM